VQEVNPPEFQLIEGFELIATAAVREAAKIEHRRRQLENVAYAFGQAMVEGKPCLIVITADEAGSRMTIRARTEPSSKR